LSQQPFGTPDSDQLKETIQLLAGLCETAQRLPEGAERQDALLQIRNFQMRMAVFVRRLGSEAQAT
jgi:hypothetical protein